MYKLIQIGIFLLLPIFLIAQSDCGTSPKDYEKAAQYMKRLKVKAQQMQQRSVAPSYVVRIQFWRISDDNGAIGPSDQDIKNQLDIVRDHFAPADICFTLVGIRYMNDDDLLLNPSDANSKAVATSLYNQFGTADVLDVLVFPSEYGDLPGSAFAIPNDYLVCTEDRWFGTKNLTHEIGHCLGLLHTHETRGQSCPSNLIEKIDGTDCDTGGDMICDTNADPLLGGINQTNVNTTTCTYTDPTTQDCNGDSPYVPPINNFMSYAWTCRSQFSPQQIAVMRAELESGDKGALYSEDFPSNTLTLSNENHSSGNYNSVTNQSINVQNNYTIRNSTIERHVTKGFIELKAGVNVDPSSGRYTARIDSDFCGN